MLFLTVTFIKLKISLQLSLYFLSNLIFLALMIGGIVVYCIPNLQGIQGLVFLIAGVICFLPGAYHVGYIYLAVKGKRGFDFNHLPLFNN